MGKISKKSISGKRMENLKVCTLDSVSPGEYATVICVSAPQPMRRRLLDLGFLEGVSVRCLMKSPLGDPCAYLVRGTVIALRREDSKTVAVEK